MKPGYPKDIESRIQFLSYDEGGRSAPVWSGYRPQFFYDNHHWDAIHNYPDEEEPVQPGQTVTAYLSFLSPELHVGKLYPGKEFLIMEGAKVVGRGEVTKIIDLEKSAEKSRAFELKRRGEFNDAT